MMLVRFFTILISLYKKKYERSKLEALYKKKDTVYLLLSCIVQFWHCVVYALDRH